MQIILAPVSVAPNPFVLVRRLFDAYFTASLDGRHLAIWPKHVIF